MSSTTITPKVTASDAVAAMLVSASAYATLLDAQSQSVSTHETSALVAFRATENGVTASAIADAARDALKSNAALKSVAEQCLYTSVATVQAHARTGQVASLPGEFADGIDTRVVQSYVLKIGKAKGFGVKAIDRVLNAATDRTTAVKALKHILGTIAETESAARKATKDAAEKLAEENADEALAATVNPTETLSALFVTLQSVTTGELSEEALKVLADIANYSTDLLSKPAAA